MEQWNSSEDRPTTLMNIDVYMNEMREFQQAYTSLLESPLVKNIFFKLGKIKKIKTLLVEHHR